MKIRQLIAGMGALALAVSLAACGGQGAKAGGSGDKAGASTQQSGAVTPDSSGPQPKVSGSGAALHLTFPNAEAPKNLKVWVQQQGTGRKLEATDLVIAHYVGQVWKNDKPFDSSFSRGAPTPFSLQNVIPGWTQALTGLPVGTKVIVSVPPELGYGPNGGNKDAGIGANDVIDFYVEIVNAFGANQSGEKSAKVETDVAALPVELTGAVGEPVSLKVKAGAAEPTKLTHTVIARGSGPVVAKKDVTVYVQYAANFWDNSRTETTYGQGGPRALPIGHGAIFDSLIGIPVGSRVLIMSPSAAGGNSGQRVPSMAVVVDILGQMPTPPAANQLNK